MKDDTTNTHIVSIGSQDVLSEILKEGAREMLASAIENEVAEYIAQYADNGLTVSAQCRTTINTQRPLKRPRSHYARGVQLLFPHNFF